jgi:YhcH/YjgK/YiaL family protein
MILDTLNNAAGYFGLGERLARGLAYLRETDLRALAPGQYEIEGSDLFAIVQDYATKPLAQGRWEAHRRYIDIQYVVEGVERFGFASTERLKIVSEEEAKDVVWFEGEGDFFALREGMFAILKPQDAHMPGIAVCEPAPVRKVVVKVRA